MSVNFVPHKPVVVDLATRRAWRAAHGLAESAPPDTVGLEHEHDYDDGARTSALEETAPTGSDSASTAVAARPESPRPLPHAAIGPGTVLRERYLLERLVGSGGACLVFSAIDRHRTSVTGVPGRLAVKLLRPESRGSPACIYRLAREFRQMQRLTHPKVARVFDIDCDGAVWFMTLELLQGDTLRQRIKSHVTTDDAFDLLRECSSALMYAHSLGITHGDLKPSNIFVTTDGSVRLLDFGSVPDREESAADPNGSHRYAATPAYASPQILLNEIADPRDDVFSLACVAYELLCGKHPFERRSSLEAMRQGLRPPYVRRIQPRHYSVLSEALSWERASRPASTHEFLHALMASELTHSQPVARIAPIDPTTLAADRPQPAVALDTIAVTAAPAEAVQTDAQSDDARKLRSAETAQAAERELGTPAELTVATHALPLAWPARAETTRAARTSRALVPLADAMRLAAQSAVAARRPAGNPRLTMFVALFFVAAFLVGIVSRYSSVGDDVAETPPAPARAAPPPPPLAAEPVVTQPLPEQTAATTAPTPKAPVSTKPSPPRHVLTFETAAVQVAVGQTLAAATLRRDRPLQGRTRMRWRTVDGTAKAGIHYEGVKWTSRRLRRVSASAVSSCRYSRISAVLILAPRAPSRFASNRPKIRLQAR